MNSDIKDDILEIKDDLSQIIEEITKAEFYLKQYVKKNGLSIIR